MKPPKDFWKRFLHSVLVWLFVLAIVTGACFLAVCIYLAVCSATDTQAAYSEIQALLAAFW